MASLLGPCVFGGTVGLSTVTKELLKFELDKSCQCSNWEARPLTDAQLRYAANDAHVLVRCYDVVAGISNLDELTVELSTGYQHEKESAKPQPLGPNDVARAIADAGLDPASVLREHRTGGFEEVSSDGKSIGLISADRVPFICLLAADKRIDLHKLKALGVRKPKLASKKDCVALFGFPVGSMPPAGHRTKMKTYVDAAFLDGCGEDAGIYALGGGGPETHAVFSRAALLQATDGIVADICSKSTPQQTLSAEEPDGEPIFLVTQDCNRLAKWLRVIGIDCATTDLSSNEHFEQLFSDADLQHRIILTCDRQLAGRRGAARCFLLSSYLIEAQFKEVAGHFGLAFEDKKFMSICSKCNSRGFEGPMSATEADALCEKTAEESTIKAKVSAARPVPCPPPTKRDCVSLEFRYLAGYWVMYEF